MIPTHGPIAAYVWQLAAVAAVHVFERLNRGSGLRLTTTVVVRRR